jgi:hypothetical protein
MEPNALREVLCPHERIEMLVVLLIVVSAANQEILGREEANLVKMGKMVVYNVELVSHFLSSSHCRR